MMDFARRLAPLRDTDITRAVAALPSRFAGDSPLRVGAAPPPVDSEGLSPSTPSPAADALPAQVASPIGVDAVHVPTAAAAAPRDVRQPRHANDSPSRKDDAVARPMIAPRHAVPAATDDRRPDAEHHRASAPAHPTAAATEAPAPPVMQSVGVRSTVAQAAAAVPFASSPSAAVSSQPMSRAALAARTSQAAEPRPIIHVTIDRIEVRAPAAPPRPALARPRAAAPSVSLGDYLRARTPKAGGAP